MAYAYRCSGPTAAVINNRTSWGPVSSSSAELPGKVYDRPLSGNFDRIFNAFDRTNSFQIVRNTFEQNGNGKDEERQIVHGDIVVNRRMSSSYERAGSNLAAQTPSSEDDEFYHEKILYSQARQLFPLQEDLADWINKTIGVTYLTGENFLDVLDNGVALCQLASVIHDRAKEALDDGLIVGVVPQIRGRCWQRAARRSFFSRDNTENFITFCRELGVHENLLFESDDLVLHNQPRQVILCLLEVARLATKFNLEPPGLVQLEKEIALEERDSGLDSAMSNSGWQFRDTSPVPQNDCSKNRPPSSPELNESQLAISDQVDNESTKSEDTVDSTDSDVPLKPTNELDKRVQLVTRLMERGCNCGAGKCSKLLKVKKVGEGRYNIAGRNVFIRLLKGRHMMVRVGGGWDTLEHFLSRHEPCQVRLVTQGRRSSVLPVPLAHDTTPTPVDKSPTPADKSPSPANKSPTPIYSKSPTPSKSPSLNGKHSPADSGRASRTSSGKTSPIPELTPRRTSTPKARPVLTLPLNSCLDQVELRKKFAPRTRKQSAPSFSTPNTPVTRNAKTPTYENRKSLGATPSTVTKKSRSISMSTVQKPFCGTDKLNAEAKKSQSLAGTPTKSYSLSAAKIRSQSLASTPDKEQKKFCGTDKLNNAAKKSRSMSLASPSVSFRPLNKAASVQGAGLTAAAIEESIRLSLAATINEDPSPKKPFLHIKAKYRSPPPAPREIPPR